MKRFAIIVLMLCAPAVASAQTPSAADQRYDVEVTTGPTFGHRTGGFVGAQGDYWLTPKLGLFAEAGWMSNVVTHGTVNSANLIASYIGGSATPKTRLAYYDLGGIYRLPLQGRFQPYVLLGIGLAHVTNDTKFTVGGSDVTGSLYSQYQVQVGPDLSGSYNKFFTTIGGGVRIPFGNRWLGDLSYRYGYVPRDTTNNLDIAAISTNRLQFGFGARF